MPTQQSARVVVIDPDGHTGTFDATVERFDPSLTGMTATYFQYRATLTGLSRATRYQYRIEANGVPVASPLSRALEFRTEAPGNFRFLHVADAGEGSAEQYAIAKQMQAQSADLVLANGDLAYDLATYTSIEDNYYSVYRELMAQVPFFATLGNHEYYTDSAKPSLSGRAHPTAGVPSEDWGRYYSFDWGNAHIVALDSNLPLELVANGTGAMLRWLEQDLANTRQFWRIVFYHHPGYATGKHAASAEAARVRDLLAPVLEKYGVQLVLNGHEHTYQRTYALRAGEIVEPNSGGIVYLTSGGGGTQTFYYDPNERIAKSIGQNHYLTADVAGPALTVQAIGIGEAGVIDALQLQPKPQITGVVNAASFTPDLAGGSAITIFGRNLFPESVTGGATEAHGCSVRVADVAVPILFADALQVNVQLPDGLTGDTTLEIKTPNGSATSALHLQSVAPALFASPTEPGTALAVSSGQLITSETPASPGESVNLYATGLRASDIVHVRFGQAEVVAQSKQSSFGGVWEITAVLPGALQGDTIAVEIDAAGVSSRPLLLPVN